MATPQRHRGAGEKPRKHASKKKRPTSTTPLQGKLVNGYAERDTEGHLGVAGLPSMPSQPDAG